MKRSLKEYAELLNNHEYGNDFDKDLVNDMKEDGVAVGYGCSDDLFELEGALSEEYDAWNKVKLVWFGNQFVKEDSVNELLEYVDDEYPMLYDSIKSMLKLDNLPFIKIKTSSDCQFEYEPSFPCEFFNIMEDDDLYCKGFVFEVKSLQNNG